MAGWSTTRDALAIKGHPYVVWTHDNHFAKVRITDISGTSIVFDWAYQVAPGNPELFTGKQPHGSGTARTRRAADAHGAH